MERAVHELETRYPDGIASPAIVDELGHLGVPLTEATLRKYVQLGLLPHSVRVGRGDGTRGSQGLYPVSVLRRIVEIKRLLDARRTIDEIRSEHFLLRSEIESLERTLRQLLDGIELSVESRTGETVAEHARRELRDVRTVAGDLVTRLRTLEGRLSVQARFARAAS